VLLKFIYILKKYPEIQTSSYNPLINTILDAVGKSKTDVFCLKHAPAADLQLVTFSEHK
jgi:hypothetical protein